MKNPWGFDFPWEKGAGKLDEGILTLLISGSPRLSQIFHSTYSSSFMWPPYKVLQRCSRAMYLGACIPMARPHESHPLALPGPVQWNQLTPDQGKKAPLADGEVAGCCAVNTWSTGWAGGSTGMVVGRGLFFKFVRLDRSVFLKNRTRGQINKASKIDW